MPTTEIPPRNPATASQPSARSQGRDLYDADSWESAYRDTYDVPALLVQLQDDLSRSRQREAFWISVVVHLTLVILLVNSEKFDRLWNRKPLVAITPREMLLQKELTYLQLPPDEQKVTKRPQTNNISDKDRIATSRSPHLDREELKKILDANRPGAPGPNSPSSPSQQPAATAQAPPGPQGQPPAAPKSSNQMAQLQTPRLSAPKPSFTNSMSAGSAIEQAARAAMANRGSYGGDSGNYGLGQGQAAQAVGNLDILSDTMGVDFGPYLKHVVDEVRQNWYNLIPESARAPLMKKGKVSIQFAIMKDGSVSGMSVTEGGSSGDVALDRAAWGGITASNPFPPLPDEFGGQYLALRFRFYYNPDKNEMP
jgi:TonB family protein